MVEKNHQGKAGRGGRTSDRKKETDRVNLPYGVLTNKSQPVGSSDTFGEFVGSAVTAQLPGFQAQIGGDAHHLTPHHSSHLGSSQTLATIGLPSPMGLGAITGVSLAGSQPGVQVAISQIISGDQHAAFIGTPFSGGSLSNKEMESIAKELELRASQANADILNEILTDHANVIQNKTLNVALRAAIKGCTTALLDGSIQCTEMLINAGANINSEEASEGKTALMMACEKGYLELVSTLLEHGALIDHKDQRKKTPLMYAIGTKAENKDVVKTLLESGADVNEHTLTGMTPLLLATKKGHAQIVKLLLARGANVYEQFPQDLNSCLHIAVIEGYVLTLRALLDHCSNNLEAQATQEVLYLLNKNNQKALDLATDLHMQKKDDSKQKEIFDELRKIYSAKEKEIEDVVQTLLKKEARTEINSSSAHQSQQQSSQSKRKNSRLTAANKGLNQQSNVAKSAPVAKLNCDQEDPSTSLVVQQPAKQKQVVDVEVVANLESKQTQKPTTNSGSTKSSKKKKGKQAAIIVREALDEDTDDEDEFKSAESKTPPKEKFEAPQTSMTSPTTNLNTLAGGNDSETVTEHSSDSEFEITRPMAATTQTKPTPAAQKQQPAKQEKGRQKNSTQPETTSKKQGGADGNTARTLQHQQQPAQMSKKQQQSAKSQQSSQFQQPPKPKSQNSGSQPQQAQQPTTQQTKKQGKSSGSKQSKSRQQEDAATAEKEGKKTQQVEDTSGLPPWLQPGAKTSQGAVQKPIIYQQQNQPQALIKQQPLQLSPQSSTSSSKKQNAAVVENIKTPPTMETPDTQQKQTQSQQQQQQNPLSQGGQPPFHVDHNNDSNSEIDPPNNFHMPLPPQQQLPQQRGVLSPQSSQQTTQMMGSGGTTIHLPIQIHKNFETKKLMLDFILEQQEMRNQVLSMQVYKQKEQINEIELEQQRRKQDHIMRVNEYYNQANRYYENFRQLENEMNTISDKNEQTLHQSLSLLGKLRGKVKGAESNELLSELESKLKMMESINKKFVDEIDFRKEDEKNYIEDQEAMRADFEKSRIEHQSFQQEITSIVDGKDPSKTQIAKTHTQYSNLLVDMESAFGEEPDQERFFSAARYPQQVFNKLHDEVIMFEESVRSIMEEIEPIKKLNIDNISSFIKQVIPDSEVEVYGSHATKLCLHWSDIDMVLKPRGLRGNDMSGYNMNHTRNWLNILYKELIKQENKGWLQHVKIIENTNVPVIKMTCNFHHLTPNSDGQVLLPNGQIPRYQEIVSKPIKVDITLWSDNHNGPPCTDLVKRYLSESQLIEPMIFVMKNMLRVWGFNDPYSGGIGSYALFLMIVSFLQEKRKPTLKNEVNLGETLLEFLRYYGHLDISQYAIQCKLPGEQSDKLNLYQNTDEANLNCYIRQMIVIDDPLQYNNNVGKSAYRFQEIQMIMKHAYDSAFTGCFCTCHFKSLCRNTSLQHNSSPTYNSQLMSHQQNQVQQPVQPRYPNFQSPPQNFFPSTMQQNQPQLMKPFPASDEQQLDQQNNINASSSNRAPYPAAAGYSQQPPASMRTQSQPFQVPPSSQHSQQSKQLPSQDETQCCCDSVLSRLIYGYTTQKMTMESLHPNLPAPLQMGSLFGGQPSVIGQGFGLPNLGGLSFMGGQNL